MGLFNSRGEAADIVRARWFCDLIRIGRDKYHQTYDDAVGTPLSMTSDSSTLQFCTQTPIKVSLATSHCG